LVFLQIALITAGQAFKDGEQSEKRGNDAAGFAADEFPGIGIFLLRHEAAAGGKFVGENDIGKRLGSEDDEVFREAGKMGGDGGQSKEVIERKIAVAD